ncbi:MULTISPECIES: TetR/AcrR family transcriptional regulator [unclassified Streptomyces]|uniref:TetR/AcrR family transcriptional regulator n=1 Tax=unclassified Streptomyces TaxID=2593676 RepID=UPI00365B41BB
MTAGNGIPYAEKAEPRRRSATRGGRPPSARSGRRPGENSTKDQILTAALDLFAAKGYSGTTIRAIAGEAGVDPALVHHFFSTKEGVFHAAVNSRLSVSSLFDALADDDSRPAPEDRAEWVARTFLSFWEDESTRPAMVAIYRTGLADESTSRTFRDRIESSMGNFVLRLVPEVTERTEVFTSLMSAQLAGLAMLRYVLKVEPLASVDFEDLLTWFVPALNVHFDKLAQG